MFDLKSAQLSVLALLLKTPELEALREALAQRYGATPGVFEQEPLCIDLSALREAARPLDFEALLALLRGHGFNPVAARGGSEEQMAAARAAGLSEAPDEVAPRAEPAQDLPQAVEPVAEVAVETPAEPVAAPVPVAEAAAAAAAAPAVQARTLIIDKPLRSGQQVYARGGDLIVLAVVSFGAEVIADGSIHVYAPLRGRALAGAQGDTSARIFAAVMEPQLVSIAGTWRTLENGLPADVVGKPSQVRLDGDKLLFEPLKF